MIRQKEQSGSAGALFLPGSRLRIEEKFRGLRHNADRAGYKLAQQVLANKPTAQ